MNYAEAVRIAGVLIRRIPESERGAGTEALAVLLRAEGVMAEVESIRNSDALPVEAYMMMCDIKTYSVMKAALRYKETP